MRVPYKSSTGNALLHPSGGGCWQIIFQAPPPPFKLTAMISSDCLPVCQGAAWECCSCLLEQTKFSFEGF